MGTINPFAPTLLSIFHPRVTIHPPRPKRLVGCSRPPRGRRQRSVGRDGCIGCPPTPLHPQSLGRRTKATQTAPQAQSLQAAQQAGTRGATRRLWVHAGALNTHEPESTKKTRVDTPWLPSWPPRPNLPWVPGGCPQRVPNPTQRVAKGAVGAHAPAERWVHWVGYPNAPSQLFATIWSLPSTVSSPH